MAERAAAPVDCALARGDALQRRYDGVSDLRARFAQETRSVAFGGPAGDALRAEGEVHFAKPGRMRWRYETPQPSEVVSDGATLWIYDPVAKEVQVLEVGAGFLSGTAIQFLLGEGKLRESFDVSAVDCAVEPMRLELTPREEATYQRLELVVASDGSLRESVVVDLLGNRTQVRLDAVETNTAPDASVFRFETPPGVRELRLE